LYSDDIPFTLAGFGAESIKGTAFVFLVVVDGKIPVVDLLQALQKYDTSITINVFPSNMNKLRR